MYFDQLLGAVHVSTQKPLYPRREQSNAAFTVVSIGVFLSYLGKYSVLGIFSGQNNFSKIVALVVYEGQISL